MLIKKYKLCQNKKVNQFLIKQSNEIKNVKLENIVQDGLFHTISEFP